MAETALLVAGIAGVGMQAMGQYQAGQAAKDEGKNAQAIAEYNAKIDEMKAVEAERAADYKAKLQEQEGLRFMAKQKSLYGKSGVLLTGTPLGVLVDTAEQLEWDRLMTIREGQIAKNQYLATAAGERMQGEAYKIKGQNAARGATLSAFGTALSGGYNIYKNT